MTVSAETIGHRVGTWHAVCRLKSILVGTGVGALVEGVPVAVFRPTEESVFAIGNIDPFSGASVMCRGIIGDIDGELVVASPIYKQHFRLADGSCVEDGSVSVPSFAATVADGEIFVQAPDA